MVRRKPGEIWDTGRRHIPAFQTLNWGYDPSLRGRILRAVHMALTDLRLKTAQPAAKPYHLTDGHGLFLVVHPNGSKLWRWKYRFHGAYRLMAFGSYPIISIADVRAAHTAGHQGGGRRGQALPPAHMFRDTFTVKMLLAGVPIDRVSLLLGHASVKITEKSYSPFVKARQVQLQESVRNAWKLGQPTGSGPGRACNATGRRCARCSAKR